METKHLEAGPSANLKELGSFLRAKRRTISAESLGIATARRRLTPGLSRDETAALAEIGASWYARLEAGRIPHPTLATMRAVSRALQLNTAESEFVLRLAGLLPAVTSGGGDEAKHSSFAGLLGNSGLVALSLWDAYLQPRGWNAIADAMYGFSHFSDPVERNPIVHLDDRRYVAFFGVHFEEYARNLVGMFRRSFAAAEPTEYARAVYERAARSPIFRKHWEDHVIADSITDPNRAFQRHHWIVGTYTATSIDMHLADEKLLLRIVAPADREAQAKFAQLRSIGHGSTGDVRFG